MFDKLTALRAAVACACLAVASPALAGTATLNHTVVKYNLASGASTAAINVPNGVPVQVLGTQTTLGFRGVASVTLLRINNSFLEWVGLESTSGAAITEGFSSAAGTHILYLDFAHQVDIEVNDPNTILIHNASDGARTGEITFTW